MDKMKTRLKNIYIGESVRFMQEYMKIYISIVNRIQIYFAQYNEIFRDV